MQVAISKKKFGGYCCCVYIISIIFSVINVGTLINKDLSLFSGGEGHYFGGEGHTFFSSCLGEGHNLFQGFLGEGHIFFKVFLLK